MDGVDQVVDDRHAVFFRDIGDVGVTGRGGWAGMAEKDLDMPKAQPLFKKMSGKAVSQRMDGYFFLMPHSATTTCMAF